MLKILDCTLRDGGYNLNWNFNESFLEKFITCVNFSDIDLLECGYRNKFDVDNKGKFYRCTPDICKEIKAGAKLGVMIDVQRCDLLDFVSIEQDYIYFVRIATHPNDITKALKIAEELKKRGYSVFLQLMDATNIKTEDFNILKKWKNKEILESIYFADTYGIFEIEDVKRIFEALKTIEFSNISFHAHNKNGNALKNTTQAIKCGAYSVDVSFQGLGRNGGNLDPVKLFDYLGKDISFYKTLNLY